MNPSMRGSPGCPERVSVCHRTPRGQWRMYGESRHSDKVLERAAQAGRGGGSEPMAFAIPHDVKSVASERPADRRYAWTVFGILFALMVVDYVDRQVVVSMFPHLKRHWTLSDAQLGALVSIISTTVALGTIPLSLLADRWSRVKSIFLMAIVWSCATIACAFAESYMQLLYARAAVGLGEAA